MKPILPLLLLACAPLAGLAAETPLHNSPPPDTEFETNIVAEAWNDFDRIMGIRFEFTASPSNNVQAAFGVDEDGDGLTTGTAEAVSSGSTNAEGHLTKLSKGAS